MTVEELIEAIDSLPLEDQTALLRHLRKTVVIHQIEEHLNCPAEVILEAVHRASDLSLRGVRGLIAEAYFELTVLPRLGGFTNCVVPDGAAFDFLLSDDKGSVSIQVKMQRQERHEPKLASTRLAEGLGGIVYVVETQRTRTGTDQATGQATRPYRFGEFDLLAVSMHPSSGDWSRFMYTVAQWLLPSPASIALIQTLQPVPAEPTAAWTDHIETAIDWFRSGAKRRITDT